MATIRMSRESNEIARFLRFVIVGLSGTLIDIGFLTLLKTVGQATLPANVLSYTLGLLNNFIWHRHWTYADGRSKTLWLQLGQFTLISLTGLLLNTMLVYLLEAPLGQLIAAPSLGYLPAKLLATALVGIWNFSLNRHWTFNALDR